MSNTSRRLMMMVYIITIFIVGYQYISEASTSDSKAVRSYLKHTLAPDEHHRIPSLTTTLIRVSKESGVPLEILVAITTVESSWDKSAVSSRGAMGLTQVMPKVWGKTLKEAGIIKRNKDLLEPYTSLKAAGFVYTHYKERFKGHRNPRRSALMAYTNKNKSACSLISNEIEMFRSKEKAA